MGTDKMSFQNESPKPIWGDEDHQNTPGGSLEGGRVRGRGRITVCLLKRKQDWNHSFPTVLFNPFWILDPFEAQVRTVERPSIPENIHIDQEAWKHCPVVGETSEPISGSRVKKTWCMLHESQVCLFGWLSVGRGEQVVSAWRLGFQDKRSSRLPGEAPGLVTAAASSLSSLFTFTANDAGFLFMEILHNFFF